VNELTDQNKVLLTKLAHSPGSGVHDQDRDDLVQQLTVRNMQLSELKAKHTELERMLEDKDEEIIELMQEVDRFQVEQSKDKTDSQTSPQVIMPTMVVPQGVSMFT
jgi:predicted RNase H-like nuclease (RuvC/YqgF family)